MDAHAAGQDLAYLRSVLDRTQRRVDPHAFHYVGWGAIVGVWYPLDNVLELRGAAGGTRIALGAVALATGALLSFLGERRLARRTDLPPEDTFVSRQISWAVAGTLVPAALLSVLGPALHLFPGLRVPIIWGLAYAAMAFCIGVVYSAEFRWGALLILAGVCAALALPTWQGLLLGPAMGVGMIVPGLVAMRRVRAARDAAGGVA